MLSCLLCLTDLLRSTGRRKMQSWEWGVPAPWGRRAARSPPHPAISALPAGTAGQDRIVASHDY